MSRLCQLWHRAKYSQVVLADAFADARRIHREADTEGLPLILELDLFCDVVAVGLGGGGGVGR